MSEGGTSYFRKSVTSVHCYIGESPEGQVSALRITLPKECSLLWKCSSQIPNTSSSFSLLKKYILVAYFSFLTWDIPKSHFENFSTFLSHTNFISQSKRDNLPYSMSSCAPLLSKCNHLQMFSQRRSKQNGLGVITFERN